MRTRLVSVSEYTALLTELHKNTFPSDHLPKWKSTGLAWITFVEREAVAFLYCEPAQDSWYFSRVGVVEAARGQGLQRKLMNKMYAALKGYMLVSTTYLNPPSANNFVRERWLTYLPAYPWGHHDTIYWYKQC
jgi:predicted GNAT superfamily acetyltransferase